MKKDNCVGCEQNFYNGNNPYGIEECWSLKTAKMVKRVRIGVWQSPPYDPKNTVKVFNCRKEKGNCLVNPESFTRDGYWR